MKLKKNKILIRNRMCVNAKTQKMCFVEWNIVFVYVCVYVQSEMKGQKIMLGNMLGKFITLLLLTHCYFYSFPHPKITLILLVSDK